MKRILLLIVLAAVCAAAQVTTRKDGKRAKSLEKAPVSAALLQRVWDSWVTLDVHKPAGFYDQEPEDVFYDIQPLEYHGWAEYEKGVQPFLQSLNSASAKVDEIRIHPSGSSYWATALVHLNIEPKQGEKSTLECRWTSVWEKRGSEWKIVHEHVSVPIPSPERK